MSLSGNLRAVCTVTPQAVPPVRRIPAGKGTPDGQVVDSNTIGAWNRVPNAFVFYCASAWRSALATKVAQQMGLAPVCHIEGGFKACQDGGGEIEPAKAK